MWRRWQPFVPGMWNRRPAAASCSKISLKTTRNFRYKVKEISLVIGWYMLNRIKNSDLTSNMIWLNLKYHFVTGARWKKQSVRQAGSQCIRNKWPMNGPYYSNMKPLWFYCPLYHPFFKKLMCTQSQRNDTNCIFVRLGPSLFLAVAHQGATASALRGCLWRKEGEGDWIYPSVRQDTHPYRICGYLFKCKSRRLSVVIVSHVTLARAGHWGKKGVVVISP